MGCLGAHPFVALFTRTARLAAVWFLARAVLSLSRTRVTSGANSAAKTLPC